MTARDALRGYGVTVATRMGHDRRAGRCRYAVSAPGVFRDDVLRAGVGTVVDGAVYLDGTVDEVEAALTRIVYAIENGIARREAEHALRVTSTADLLTKAYALTHRIHQLEHRYPSTPAADERASRDLITAEIVRRTDQ